MLAPRSVTANGEKYPCSCAPAGTIIDPVIRVLIADDHPALRAGLRAVLDGEPGLVAVGAASGRDELVSLLRHARPDVVLLDYQLPETDGLTLCRQVKHQIPAPRVLLYSAYADEHLRLPALLAGADGLLDKGTPPRELFDAIRAVARGRRLIGAIGPAQLEAAMARLNPEDGPIVAMLIDETPVAGIAEVLRLPVAGVQRRIQRILGRLTDRAPAPVA
jgi:DNA-binding NarL/FixJ family response regulator